MWRANRKHHWDRQYEFRTKRMFELENNASAKNHSEHLTWPNWICISDAGRTRDHTLARTFPSPDSRKWTVDDFQTTFWEGQILVVTPREASYIETHNFFFFLFTPTHKDKKKKTGIKDVKSSLLGDYVALVTKKVPTDLFLCAGNRLSTPS